MRDSSQPPTHRRSWWVLGIALSIELIFFSSITFFVAYDISDQQIHAVGAQLASSMASTILTRVSAFLNLTESALIVTAASGTSPGMHKLPSDFVGDSWVEHWLLELRTALYAARFAPVTLAVLFADGGLAAVGTWWSDPQWIYSFAADPRSLRPEEPCDNCSIEQRYDMERRRGNVTVTGALFFNKDTGALWNHSRGVGFVPYTVADSRQPGYWIQLEQLSLVRPRDTALGPVQCYWSFSGFRTFTLPGDFLCTGFCVVRNASGYVLGMAQGDLPRADMDVLLLNAASTPHTVILIVDTRMFVAASSYHEPFTRTYNLSEAPPALRDKNGCFDSYYYSPAWPRRVGCRVTAENYTYPPLQALARADPEFITNDGRQQGYGTLSDQAYYYVSARIPSQFSSAYGLNLVLFLPELDVVFDSKALLIISLTVCGVLCIFGALMANVMAYTLLRRPALARKPKRVNRRARSWPRIKCVFAAYERLVSSIRDVTSLMPRDLVWHFAAPDAQGSWLASLPVVEGSVAVIEVRQAELPYNIAADTSPAADDESASNDSLAGSLASWVSANDVYIRDVSSIESIIRELSGVILSHDGMLELATPQRTLTAVYTGQDHALRAIQSVIQICSAVRTADGFRAAAGVDSGRLCGRSDCGGVSAYRDRIGNAWSALQVASQRSGVGLSDPARRLVAGVEAVRLDGAWILTSPGFPQHQPAMEIASLRATAM